MCWSLRAGGVLDRAGVEGTGSYGAALTRYLRHGGITVIEVNRPDRAARRRGKTDAIDAAHAVLSDPRDLSAASPFAGVPAHPPPH